jgi:K+-transporting ATPase ATPase A chain
MRENLLAGAGARKKVHPHYAGAVATHGMQVVVLVAGVILIVGGLTFFPALSLGPVVEHLAMTAGQTF